MTTGGGSNMQFGDDYVAARLSVDVPEGSAQAIREITQEVERFHTTLEAAIRSEADAVRYLDQMADSSRKAAEAQSNLVQQYQMFLSVASRGGMPSSQVPLGPAAMPFAGATHGMGDRPPSSSDVSSQLAASAQSNPREYLNMQAARNNLSASDMISINPASIAELANKISERDRVSQEQRSRTDGNTDNKPAAGGMGPEDPYTGIQQRIGRASSLAGQIMNEMGPGGSVAGMGQMALQGLNWARRRALAAPGKGGGGNAESMSSVPPEEGSLAPPPADEAASSDEATDKGTGGLGGILKMLGPVAGVATAALSIFGVIQKGGSMVQGMRNVASIRGGAAGEGAEVEYKARMMAMNPFITSDQARQIYQAVMSEGYADASGAGADNVIDFMQHNLTTMNMAQPLSSLILTPQGWAKMGELQVGDIIIAGDGTPTTVLKISERGLNEVYELQFSDGTHARSTMDHLWQVYLTNEKASRSMFLSDIAGQRRSNSAGLLRPNGRPRFRVPLVGPVQYPVVDLPIDPYTLGILLGDGSFGYGHVSVTCFEPELYPLVLPDGVRAIPDREGHYRLSGAWNRWHPNPLMVALRDLGLGGATTKVKFIPEDYLQSSVDQRFSLLQGLIDTDGHIDKNGIVFFTNSSPGLIVGVGELVRSLGGQIKTQKVAATESVMKSGQVICSGESYRMHIRLPGHLGPPCRLERKAQRYIPRMLTDRGRTKAIVEIRRVADETCRCILVDHPDQLYVTDNFTVTHNSVAESGKALRSIIVGSGEGDKNSVASAVQMLGKELDTIRTLSREGAMSQPDYRAGVERTQQALMNAGVNPEQAMQSALTAEQVGSGDQVMKGQFGRIAASMAEDRNGVFLRQFGGPGGTPIQGLDNRLFPQLTAEALGDQGGDAQNRATVNALGAIAKQSSVAGPEENSVYVFQQRLKMMGLDTDATTNRPTARKLFEQLRSGEEGDELKQAEQDIGGAGGGSRGGGGKAEVSGNVKIDLTPQAAQLLQVVGGNNAKLTATQSASNKGIAGYSVNNPTPGDN